jgi:hypothetical protein
MRLKKFFALFWLFLNKFPFVSLVAFFPLKKMDIFVEKKLEEWNLSCLNATSFPGISSEDEGRDEKALVWSHDYPKNGSI